MAKVTVKITMRIKKNKKGVYKYLFNKVYDHQDLIFGEKIREYEYQYWKGGTILEDLSKTSNPEIRERLQIRHNDFRVK